MITSEAQLRRAIVADLPPAALQRRPFRVLLLLPLIALVVGTSALLLQPALSWYLIVPTLLVLGNAYVALMFFGHEVAHGATVRSRRLQDAVLWPTCAIFVVSSHLWRYWHNELHHGRTNVPSDDPDRYDLVEDLPKTPAFVRWLTTRFAPGAAG
jgi:fatty acid desaturase